MTTHTARDDRETDIRAAERIYKQYETKVEPLEERRVRFTITTSDPDRERDVVFPAGIELAGYLKNPLVLFAHDARALPIGRTIRLDRSGNGLVADAEFATADLNPMAEQVFRMIRAGYLRGASIGFRPLEWNYDEERKGINFMRTELLEWSVVPIPANADALVAARAAGIDVALLKTWAEGTLAALRQAPAGGDTVTLVLDDEAGATDDGDPLITVRRSQLVATIRESVAPLERQARALVAQLARADPDMIQTDLSGEELDELIEDVLREELAAVVRRETLAAVDALRGRVD